MCAACKWAVTARVLFIIVTLASTTVVALQAPQTPPITLEPANERVSLAASAEVACDRLGDISLEAAQGLSYISLTQGMPTSGDCAGYWVRFSVAANDLPTGGWLLQLSHLWLHADLYFLLDGVVSSEQTGLALPPQDRSLASSRLVLPLTLSNASPQVFYLHLAGNTTRYGESRAVDAQIVRLGQWAMEQRRINFGQGTYAGIITALALYNLILFLAIEERVYLYYVLYVVSFGSVWIARTGFFFQYLWPRHSVWDESYLPYLAASAIAFSALFVREFLATRRRSPRVDLLLRGIVVVTVVVVLTGIVTGADALALPLAILGLAVSILYAMIGLVALHRGFRPARFFLLAWTALLLGNVIFILMFLRLLPQTFVTNNAAQAGSALECILLAFALADRVNLFKRARDERQLQYTRELQEQVKKRTGELSDAVERLKQASVTDPLTGLSNRRHVDAAVQPWIAELLRARIRNTQGEPRRSLAICLADLDHFKLVNDDLGHAAGDRVLRAAAETLRHNVRATAILSRWGGEEFLVLDHVVGPYEDVLMAERLRQSMVHGNSPVTVETGRVLSLSLGVVRYPFSEAFPELLDWDHCLALADHALYRAKKAGRNRWHCYRPNEDALRKAVRELGADEVRRLLRLHSDEAFSLGLLEAVEQVPAGAEVV